MATVLVTVVLVVLLFAAMSVGILLGRAPVRGSCGGMGAAGVEGDCVAGCNREPGEPCPRRQPDEERG
ncbi:MAG: (Na+)-NQR maturation NqrM [Lysobacteraceae bacterium]